MKSMKLLSCLVSITFLSNMFVHVPSSVYADESTAKIFEFDDFSVTYNVTSSWGNTEIISLDITNTGTDIIEDWMLYFLPHGDLQDAWNANIELTSSGIPYFKNAGYNANIPVGSTVSFSYSIDNCKSIPQYYTLCQKRQDKETGYSVDLKVNQSWGDSFNGSIRIFNNTDEPIEMWELTLDTNFTITKIPHSWSATVTELEPYSYLFKGTNPSDIPANSYIDLGFEGVMNGTPELGDYFLSEILPDENIIYNASLVTEEYTLSDIQDLNSDSIYGVDIKTNDEGYIYSIDGKFSDVLVTDEESALNALYGVKNLLGMSNPKRELLLDYIYESDIADYNSYFFNEYYDNIPVYGRNVTVVARENGETLSLDSNYLDISNINTTPVWSVSDIEAEYNIVAPELIIYTYDEYENEPQLAYLSENDTSTIVFSANTGEILTKWECEFEEYTNDSMNTDTNVDLRDSENRLIHSFCSFYNSSVKNVEDALDVVKQADLNVNFFNSSDNTLSIANEQYTPHKKTYHFAQQHKGITVFGRQVSVSVKNTTNKAYSLDSNIVEIPDTFDVIPQSSFVPFYENSTLVIYTWDENENDMAPQLAYISDDIKNNKTIIQLADGNILYKDLGKGLDEGEYVCLFDDDSSNFVARPMKLHYFPVTSLSDGNYKLSVTTEELNIKKIHDSKIEVRQMDGVKSSIQSSGITNETINSINGTYFYAPEAVAVYVNAIKVFSWYADSSNFNRDYYSSSCNDLIIGIDGYYMGTCNNAVSNNNYIYICPKQGYTPYTFGTALDVVAHEFTHRVFGDFALPDNYTGTVRDINEGYADLFGHFIDGNWLHREAIDGDKAKDDPRNAANDITSEIDFTSPQLGGDHTYISYIVHPAYLMAEKYGIDLYNLYNLYYASMSQGRYDKTSTMNSVRINVIKAAKALEFSEPELQKVMAAFDEIWPNDSREYHLTVNAFDYDDTSLTLLDAEITIDRLFDEEDNPIVLSNGVSQVTEPGWYALKVKANGYITYCYNFYMNYTDTVLPIRLVQESTIPGTLTVQVSDFVNKLPVDATVNVYRVEESGSILVGSYLTGESVGTTKGKTNEISVLPGYYVVSADKGDHYFLQPVIVSPGNNKNLSSSYSDVNLNEPTDIFYFNTVEYKEDINECTTSKFNIGTPKMNHYTDSEGNKIAEANVSLTQFGFLYNVYCYERENEEFILYYPISTDQYEILKQIYNYEMTNSSYHTKLYNLEIKINRRNSDFEHTITITAEDIFNQITDSKGNLIKNTDDKAHFEFAKIKFDNSLNTYTVKSLIN